MSDISQENSKKKSVTTHKKTLKNDFSQNELEEDRSSLADYLEGAGTEGQESEGNLRMNKKIAKQLTEPIQEEEMPNEEDDAIDRAIKKVKFHIMTFGYPDPGNLKSSKRKEIKLRIKCMAAMLKQREKDIEYRQQFDNRL